METVGSSSGARSMRPWHEDQFIDLVLSWSTRDILDQNLYKNQVDEIPMSFESVDKYLGSYVYPLLEETRAHLASAMETVYRAPFAEIKSFTQSAYDTLHYNVNVDCWENRQGDGGREAYIRTLPGDIVMVSKTKPETASDLERAGWNYTLACVVNIPDDEGGEGCNSCNFVIRTAELVEFEHGQNDTLYVVFLLNVTPYKRIWSALTMRRNLRIIEKIISTRGMDEGHCKLCPRKCNSKIQEKLEPSLSSKLNESQLESILVSLSKTECYHKSSVELIWGPPGTGKTTTMSILLYTLLRMNVRTLICAPTNVAITELASRVLALARSSFNTELETSFGSFPLGDMLIFGNKDRLEVGSDVEEILLDHRVQRLVECLTPFTGWRQRVDSMLDFLVYCVSHYQIFTDHEINKAKQSPQEDEDCQHSESMSLLEFAKDRFSHLAKPLRECMLTFLTHLPRSFLQEHNFQNIRQLMLHLCSMEMLLFENSRMTCNELENAFLGKELMVGSEPLVDGTSSLLFVRSQCLSILKSIRASLLEIGLPIDLSIGTEKSSTTELCFQKASLIFCTTSSSFKLHSIEMEPFRMLIIDEAAQVKESESVIPFQILNVKHAVLVGDECQLPATVMSPLSKEVGFGRSLFERLSLLGHSKHLLNVQYRMHPIISQFPNSNFYQNQILDAPYVQSRSYERSYLQGRMFGPYSFINIRDGQEELGDVGHSRRNMVEVAVAVKLVHKLFKAWNGSNENLSIGLISPYAAQVEAIRDKLSRKYENHKGFVVKVKSVDGFQGGEEDIIIVSTVWSYKCGSIGFLASPQRTNVALTRARHCLWILGNEGTLCRSDSVWEAIVCDAKRRNCFFNADEDNDFQKTVIEVKKELDQLDDLLSGESVLFRHSRWKVLLSENFRKSFQRLKPSNVKNVVINLLLRLASGWRPKKVNVDMTCESSQYIVKQFKVEKYHVVCSIDIIKDSIYVQVLKVWDILPMVETPKLLKRLDCIFAMYTDDFINHCNSKFLENNLEVPKIWPVAKEIIRFKNLNTTTITPSESLGAVVDGRSFVEYSKVNESLLLMKFYSLSSGTVKHLLTDLEGREVDLPFEVTDEEREIIMFSRSSFILGRSGTGKTTILTMKLFQKYQQYVIASRDSMATDNKLDFSQYLGESSGTVLRQIFVTVSPKLCYAVKKHVSQLQSFANGNYLGNKFTDMDDIEELTDFRDIPDTFVGIQFEKYPLVVTFHKFLMMLDGTLGNTYFERFRGVRGLSQYEGRRSVALQTFIRQNEVTYDRFQCLYWPHFNVKLTKNLDPSRVFTEIMSHIKGALQEGGSSCDSKRSRQDYISLSDSRVSTLSAEKREVIYDIFDDYEKMKLERGEFDLADFVVDIHLRLRKGNLIGDKMDFVYIDEVQDLTMSQISLFRYICKNVDDGFVFCGDTAQTIARGIDFRFEDIRSLFYKEFYMKSINSEYQGQSKGLASDMFCLSQNFRTHTGVLRLAQSVIDVIFHFFPQSIDVLPPEKSIIYGESPVVLEPGSDENLIMTIFGHSGKAGGKWVGFGADQVILVRDDSARKEISSYIGDQALVLTLVECKGLEFQDVLLYNFFGSSPLSNQWRVVYEFLKERDLLDANSPSFPSFSQSKHNIMCSELKQLYVAITRTRQRLWICENDVELSRPMLDYWKRLCLVQVKIINDSLVKAMQRASSPEEWKSQGIKLFWEKNYEMATLCFEKAGDETWEKRAKASGLRSSADTLHSTNPEESRTMLREAAEIFDAIGRADSAAECFCDLGEYERAGNIYLKGGKPDLRRAGECFSLAGSYRIAAQVYGDGYFFEECLSACAKGNYFDFGVQYIEQWKQQASLSSGAMVKFKEMDKIAQEFLEKIALECYKKKHGASLIKFVRAFNTMETKRNFLKSLDCIKELLILEEESGNFNEAAEIAKSLGDIVSEADLLEKAGDFANASLLILSYVLSNSLWLSGSQEGWPLKSFPQKEKLLTKAMSVAQKVGETFHSSVCAEANAIRTYEQRDLSALMRCYMASKQHKTHSGEVLSLRKLLDAHVRVRLSKYEWDPESHTDPKLFVEKILRNQVSCRTLVYIWNLWRASVLGILDCLDSLEGIHLDGCEDVVRFCCDYLGVRLTHNLGAACILMKPDAAWVGYVAEKRFIVRKRKVATLEVRHFASAAQKYWRQELVSTGFRVLEALQLFHKSSVKSSSIYCQCACLTCIYEVTRFFIESNSLEMKKGEKQRVQDFLQLSMKYSELVFPLDSQQSLSKKLVLLRETEISKNLLEEIISKNIGSLNDVVTFRQIGHVVMMLLGSGKPKHDLCKKFLEKLGSDSPWKPFIENLTESVSGLELYKSILLHKALLGDPKIKTEDDEIISPNCLVYLVERLLITVPHPQGFFFTTKSSFTECLTWLQSDANPSSIFPIDSKFYARDTFKFVAEMVHPSLDFPRLTIEWINMCHMDSRYYFPLLMLRLLLILCTLCLNSYTPLSEISKALDAPQIIQQLPREFREALSRTGENNSYAARIAEACKIIGDPLVIVSYSGSRPKFVSPDAIFINLRSCSCKNEVMNILYPETTCNQSTTVEKHMTESVITRPPPVSDHAESHSENGKENMFIKLALMRDIFETLGLLNNTNDNYEKMESLVPVLLEKEVEVLKHIKFMISIKAEMCELQNQMPSEEDKDVMWEVTTAFSELMDTSDIDLKAQSNLVKGILTSVDGNSPQVDAFWTRLNRKKERNASVAGDGNSEGSTAGGAECSQMKTKKMKNKSNKGKGSRHCK